MLVMSIESATLLFRPSLDHRAPSLSVISIAGLALVGRRCKSRAGGMSNPADSFASTVLGRSPRRVAAQTLHTMAMVDPNTGIVLTEGSEGGVGAYIVNVADGKLNPIPGWNAWGNRVYVSGRTAVVVRYQYGISLGDIASARIIGKFEHGPIVGSENDRMVGTFLPDVGCGDGLLYVAIGTSTSVDEVWAVGGIDDESLGIPTPTAVPLAPGLRATTVYPAELRRAPSTSAVEIALVRPGAPLLLIDMPETVDNIQWWPVTLETTGESGYIDAKALVTLP